jgi:iron(III) transport system ATP-binding protein
VALSVRPENVELSESPLDGPNVWSGVVEQKVFLGEAIDFRVTVNGRALLSRQHPTLRTPVGGSIVVRIQPDKCVVFPGV